MIKYPYIYIYIYIHFHIHIYTYLNIQKQKYIHIIKDISDHYQDEHLTIILHYNILSCLVLVNIAYSINKSMYVITDRVSGGNNGGKIRIVMLYAGGKVTLSRSVSSHEYLQFV